MITMSWPTPYVPSSISVYTRRTTGVAGDRAMSEVTFSETTLGAFGSSVKSAPGSGLGPCTAVMVAFVPSATPSESASEAA